MAMNQLGISPTEIEQVFMAGAFGTYIHRESALNIGMLPEFNLLDIEQVGNVAGTGARMALLSREARYEAQKIREKVEYIGLAINPSYNQAYLDALMFPHKDLSLFPITVKKLGSSNWIRGSLHLQ